MENEKAVLEMEKNDINSSISYEKFRITLPSLAYEVVEKTEDWLEEIAIILHKIDSSQVHLASSEVCLIQLDLEMHCKV